MALGTGNNKLASLTLGKETDALACSLKVNLLAIHVLYLIK